jgi:hypothetical protein
MNNPNIYDTIEEAARRLYQTVVTYDGEPCYVMTITNHRSDGKFRLYLWPVQHSPSLFKAKREYPEYTAWQMFSNEQGAYLDKWMEEHKDSPLMRKTADSPAFNKFRPFPLGMINKDTHSIFLARSPARRTQQGLTIQMIDAWTCSLDTKVTEGGRYSGHLNGPDFYDCVKGTHPSAQECLEKMFDPAYEQRKSVAFHRNFAFIRGPLDTFYLQYKTDVVGFVPKSTRPTVELGKKFTHLKETVEETRQFFDIKTQK